MKKSKFNKWLYKNCFDYEIVSHSDLAKDSWNAACKSILTKVKQTSKILGPYARTDMDILEEEIKEMIEK